MNTGTQISYIPPKGYFILADDAVVKSGDMYWSSTIKDWSPCCDSCGTTVKVNKQQYYFKAAVRKITTMPTLEEQITEAKNKVLVLEFEYKQQKYKNLLAEAAAEGWKVGATIDGSREMVTDIFVADADNYQSSSGNVEREWEETKKPFVAIKYGCCASPASMLKVGKASVIIRVHGFDMRYGKGDNCVTFGCARISIPLLRAVVQHDEHSNREVTRIRFDSDKDLVRNEVIQILEYVDYINKQ